jgi:ribonuclease-3
LTLYKIVLIKEETLANIARQIWLWDKIFLWHWEEKTGGRDKDTILADSLESLIGYIYLDLWLDETRKFVKKYVYSKLNELISKQIKSYKSLLQEKVQKLYKIVPEYKNYEWEKDEKWNIITYKSEVYILGEKKWEGYWPNKKKAQEEAAKMAYTSW